MKKNKVYSILQLNTDNILYFCHSNKYLLVLI